MMRLQYTYGASANTYDTITKTYDTITKPYGASAKAYFTITWTFFGIFPKGEGFLMERETDVREDSCLKKNGLRTFLSVMMAKTNPALCKTFKSHINSIATVL
jgi:hypothetical protein